MAMRVVVVGASGNVGTSLLRELADEPAVESVLGLSRRVPELDLPKVEWRAADICDAPLETLFAEADAVVHLAWLIQPARDRALTRQVNVGGSERVFRAVAKAGVKTLVYASSVGAYARGRRGSRSTRAGPPRASNRPSTPWTRWPSRGSWIGSRKKSPASASCAFGPA